MKYYDLTKIRTKWYKELPIDPTGESFFIPRGLYQELDERISSKARMLITMFIAKDQDPKMFYDEKSLISLSRNDDPFDEYYLTPFRLQKYINELIKYGILIEVED